MIFIHAGEPALKNCFQGGFFMGPPGKTQRGNLIAKKPGDELQNTLQGVGFLRGLRGSKKWNMGSYRIPLDSTVGWE